jgi:hypothetical protein
MAASDSSRDAAWVSRRVQMRGLRACGVTILVTGVLAVSAVPARADGLSAGCRNDTVLSVKGLFSTTLSDFKNLPSKENAMILGVGAGAALATHPSDTSTSSRFSQLKSGEETFESGAYVGGTAAQVGGAFLTYGLGRAFHNDCVAAVGGELVRAQLVSQALVLGIKGAVQRPRPEGSGYSFPSGHTASAFATATVLQRNFGWKFGGPAYAAATYVAASRVQGKHHYVSDVAFGAALGVVAGRTVTMGSHKFELGPVASDFGPAAGFTLVGKK